MSRYRISIKIPAPDWKKAPLWGDYHFASSLKKQFEALGHEACIHVLSDWYSFEDSDDVVLTLRGGRAYAPDRRRPKLHLLWNISHPSHFESAEYNRYDHIFVASRQWADHLRKIVKPPVEVLLQCTDSELFHPSGKQLPDGTAKDLLFVGDSRKNTRKIINDLLPCPWSVAIYGQRWNRYIEDKYIKGSYIPNGELRRFYASSSILLNDHWEDMRRGGFINNRAFDGLAAEAFMITDDVAGITDVFGDTVATYRTREELHQLIDYYLRHPEIRRDKASRGGQLVRKHHTFAHRAKQIVEVIEGRMGP